MSRMVPSRPWRRAVAWLILLGPLFFLSYGFANAMAEEREGVSSIVFDWEARIPFLAWTIVPYWSIDMFYVASLFVCRDRRELDLHALRLLSAQVLAVACFLLWPLRFSFDRPETYGAFGWLFDALLGFDKPFNQAPSLHIVLLVILWVRFARHTPPRWHWLLNGWFALIGLSVLTTYQHHFIDVPAGVLAGWLCVWLWPEQAPLPWRNARLARDTARWRLAVLYLVGAAICTGLACTFQGGTWWLLWPATSLLLVMLNYALFGAYGFQKESGGGLSKAAIWLYAPYVLGAWLNSRWWTRHSPAAVPVTSPVWLGRAPGHGERDTFDRVVDVCAELPLRSPQAGSTTTLPMLDLIAPQPQQLRDVARAIDIAVHAGGRVLVCCALGYSRSAAAVAAWLLHSGKAHSVDEAIAQVRSAGPDVVLKETHRAALRQAFEFDSTPAVAV